MVWLCVWLVVIVDDFGYCLWCDEGIVEVFLVGVVISVFLLVNGVVVESVVELVCR